MTWHPVTGSLAMRTMQHLVAVVILSGMLLFPSQSAQACHGWICSLCAGRGYSGASGFAGYGYGAAYGYSPSYSYMPSYNYGWGSSYPYWAYPPRPPLGSSDESQPRSSTTSTANDRLAALEARVESINVSTHNRLLGLEGGLEKLRTSTADDMKTLNGKVDGLDKTLNAKDDGLVTRVKKIEDVLVEMQRTLAEIKKKTDTIPTPPSR
jgi:hypothetical protein